MREELRFWHVLLSLVLLPTGLWGQSLQALDAQNGALELSFEAPLDSAAGPWVYTGKFERKLMFYRPKDRLEFAGVPLESIRYITWAGKLHSIRMRTAGEGPSDALATLLETFYGPGEQQGMAPAYTWRGKRVILSYEKNLLTKNALVVFESLPMQIQFEREMGARLRD